MANNNKLRVAVIYGGKSGEHEVSLRSAASVVRHLDEEKYSIVPISIDKEGKWTLNDVHELLSVTSESLPVKTSKSELISSSGINSRQLNMQDKLFDVVFPVLHGPLYEDGALQGFLDLAGLPYVGSGVLSSAIGMDKDISKRLVKMAGIPVTGYAAITKGVWEQQQERLVDQIYHQFNFPVFVKPANLGSSVATFKVSDQQQLIDKINEAFSYDIKILVEKAVDAREIELAVLENQTYGLNPHVSIPGEIVVSPKHEFYSYEAKYLDEEGAKLCIPAELDEVQIKQAQEMTATVFTALGCESMARVDLFFDKKRKRFLFNEINTLPGFTSISMYPKLWEASGMPYKELLTYLVELAVARHKRKSKINRVFEIAQQVEKS